MYSLIVVFILGLNFVYSRVIGSAEFRYATIEQCREAEHHVEHNWRMEGHRVVASCVFKLR
jgi:hypothetical protein